MVCLELYANKTQLLPFGTGEGYPVMARITSLPVGIRNSNSLGGAWVVGWLLVVHSKYMFLLSLDLILSVKLDR